MDLQISAEHVTVGDFLHGATTGVVSLNKFLHAFTCDTCHDALREACKKYV